MDDNLSLLNKMAQAISSEDIEAYIGDLIHDGHKIANTKVGDTLYWLIKSNGCGTWLADRDFMVYASKEGFKKLFKITVTRIENTIPFGEIEKVETV